MQCAASTIIDQHQGWVMRARVLHPETEEILSVADVSSITWKVTGAQEPFDLLDAEDSTGTVVVADAVFTERTDRGWPHGEPGWNVQVLIPGTAFVTAGTAKIKITIVVVGTDITRTHVFDVSIRPAPA